jgi:HlyD family secretion protein
MPTMTTENVRTSNVHWRFIVKKLFFGLMLVGTVLALAGCGAASTAPAAPTAAATGLNPIKASSKIVAEGTVVPATSANLAMAIGGIAAEVLVKEGDRVSANQPLLRLASAQQQAAIATAQAALSRAQAGRQKLFQGPDDNQLTAARADLANAQAALKQAQAAYDQAGGASNPYAGMLPTSLALEQAYNNYAAAKARLDALQKPPRPADIAAADADIAVAQADLDRAKAALTDAELRAPFAGTIATVNVKVGEQVTPGATVIQLADFSAWEIQTTDLTEINIVKVDVGDAVTLTFDAIPGLELPGKVERVKALGTNRQGDIVYTVTTQPDKSDERLRWNMTAKVSITPKNP